MDIAFLTLNAYDMLTGGYGGSVGGAQLQQILIGRELADRGHTVHFIERDADGKTAGRVEGVNVALKPHRTSGSLPVKAVKRTTDTLQLLRRLDVDACYARVPKFEVLPAATYCRLSSARFVYGFAHDSELTDNPVVFETRHTDNAVYRYLMQTAIGSADALIAQNDFQYREATEQFDTAVRRIQNGYPVPDSTPAPALAEREMPVVLWVSTLRPWKQPELVLDLADELPEAVFVIVGGPDRNAPAVAERFETSAERYSNVIYEGFVPYEEIDAYYEAADIFLNTSTDEGFPNTFLEAWAHRTPVVSLAVNPSDVLTDREIGYVAGASVDTLATKLRSLVTDPERRATLGQASFEYFRANHSLEHVASEYESVFTASQSCHR